MPQTVSLPSTRPRAARAGGVAVDMVDMIDEIE
jgi:hypothetical protein